MIIDDKEFILDYDDIQGEYTDKTAKKIQKDAPKNKGNYAKGIGVTKIDNETRIIHNKGKHYRLGHILENGTKNQKAQPHYRPNHKPEEYAEAMRKVDIKEK